MPLYTFSLPVIELFFLVYMRLLGLLYTLPVFNQSEFKSYVRAGFAGCFALAIMRGLPAEQLRLPDTLVPFVLLAILEFFLGTVTGWLTSWVAEAVAIGMQMVGFQMGLAIVNVFDPSVGTAISITATLHVRLAMLVFLIGGLYLPFLEGAAISFRLVPPGAAVFTGAHAAPIMEMAGLAFRMSVALAGAPIASLLVVKIGLGILARTVPQMNVFIVGFPLTIAVGFVAAAAAMPLFVNGVQHHYAETLERMMLFIRSLRP